MIEGGSGTSNADILLVDDDPIFLRLLAQGLKAYPNQRYATSGQEGLRLARSIKPDLILLDIEMPEIGGIEFMKEIRADPRLCKVPVIFITSHRGIPLAVEAFKNGGRDLINKPVDHRKLLSSIEQFLAPPRHDRAANSGVDLWPRIEGINPDIVRDYIGDDIDLFMTLLRELLDQFGDIEWMSAKADADTLRDMSMRMHRLKGASAMLGVEKLSELAGVAESIGRDGDLAGFARVADAAAIELALLRERIDAAGIEHAEVSALAQKQANAPGSPFDVTALARSLRRQSLSSLRQFDEREGDVAAILGAPVAKLCRDHLTQFRFGCAADLLELRSAV